MSTPGSRLRDIFAPKPGQTVRLDVRGLALVGGVFLALTILLSIDLVPLRFLGVRAGQPSARTIVAPEAVQVVDTYATRIDREKAQAAVPPQYRLDPNAVDRVVAAIDGFYLRAAAVRRTGGLTAQRRFSQLRAVAPRGVSDSAIRMTVALSPQRLQALSLETRRLVSLLLVGTVTEGDLDHVRTALSSAVAGLSLPAAERAVVEGIGQATIIPTYVEDAARQAELRRAAASAIAPVVLSRQKGEVVVRQGEVVTREDALLLRALGLTRTRFDSSRVLGVALLVTVAMLGVALYLHRMETETFKSLRLMTILALVTIGVALVSKLAIAINATLLVTAVPIVVAPMLATLLINPRVGFVSAVAGTVVLATATQFSADAMVWSLMAGVFAVFATSEVTRRSGFYRAGAIITLACGAAAFAVWLFAGSSLREAANAAVFGFVGGLLSTVLTIGSLPFYESVFSITTDLRLADLTNPDQPLLKRLTMTAPGTHNHSVIVGSLAEAGAEAVGANAMLARAGAYYHDVGKTRRPLFFVENQIGGIENPHDHTNPRLSSLVIASHVKEGVELAEQARLPTEIIDIIRQHHGTSVVSYFYQRAVEQEGYQAVSPDDFRYEGAKPQSREAAIVMLADGVEAMVRSLSKPTPQRIEAAVKKIIQAKVDDGQLDDSHLTISELDTITRAFASVLAGMYHSRVEYPERAMAQRRKVVHGGSDG